MGGDLAGAFSLVLISFAGLIMVVWDSFRNHDRMIPWFGVAACAVAVVYELLQLNAGAEAVFYRLMWTGGFASFVNVVILVGAALTIVLSVPYLKRIQHDHGEVYALLMFASVGMMLLGIPDSERKEKALSIMDELGIKELADKKPNEMSGGQQQRVAVARAIINNPTVVLADEPTANLDSKTASVLLDLMQKMNEEKEITCIFSSHDKQVMDRAKRLLILTDGKIEK